MLSIAVLIEQLQKEFDLWVQLFDDLSEEQAHGSKADGDWTIKDIFAHLTAWQQLTLARLHAAKFHQDPDYPAWYPGFEPETNEDTNRVNAQIYTLFISKKWSVIYSEWQERFKEVISVAVSIPDADLTTAGRYEWLKGYPALSVLAGTLDHHREHRESLLSNLSGFN